MSIFASRPTFRNAEEVEDFFYSFLRDWLCWAITDISLSGTAYHGRMGLCGALASFCHRHDIYAQYSKQSVRIELYKRFTADGLDIDYPFGRGAFRLYMDAHRLHKDPNRVNWVKKQLPRHHAEFVDKFVSENMIRIHEKVEFK